MRRFATVSVLLLAGCGIDSSGVSGLTDGAGGAAGGFAGAGGTAGRETVAGAAGSGAMAGTSTRAGSGGAAGKAGASGKSGFGGAGAMGANAGASGDAGSAGTASGGLGGVGGASAGAGIGGSGSSGAGGTQGGSAPAGQGGARAGNDGAANGGASNGGAGNGGAADGGAGNGGAANGGAGNGGSGGTVAGNGGSGAVGGSAGSGGSALPCGNGKIDAGEACDDGSGPSGSTACVNCQLPCAVGGLVREGHCYFSVSLGSLDAGGVKSDVEAQRYGQGTLCRAQGAHLASLGGDGETSPDFLTQLAKISSPTAAKLDLVLGVTSENEPNGAADWTFIDGTETAPGSWFNGEPAKKMGCTVLGLFDKLRVVGCNAASVGGALCEREPTCAVKSTTLASGKALLGYPSAEGHCFVSVRPSLTWSAAKAACEQLTYLDGTGKGRLAVFETNAELATLPGTGFLDQWIGASQTMNAASIDAGWAWLDGSSARAGEPGLWDKDRPNDKGDNPAAKKEDNEENCADLNGNRLVDDRDCEQPRGMICEVQ